MGRGYTRDPPTGGTKGGTGGFSIHEGILQSDHGERPGKGLLLQACSHLPMSKKIARPIRTSEGGWVTELNWIGRGGGHLGELGKHHRSLTVTMLGFAYHKKGRGNGASH